MADGTVSFFLSKLESLLQKEEQLLSGARTGARDIKDELDTIQSLLRDADAGEAGRKHGFRTWVQQAREIAYDIEDVLEEFMLHFEQPRGRGGLSTFIRRSSHFLKHLRARRRIATQIQELRSQVQTISVRMNMYNLSGCLDDSSNPGRDRSHDRHVASLFVEEAELVGIDKPREELIGWLVAGDDPSLKVISVVGMGGLGKTTLVRKVYDDERVKGLFSCRAWLTVTRSFTIEDLLKSIIRQFSEDGFEPLPEEMDAMEDIQLTAILRSYLRDKRYVVVFDDVWHINAWEGVKHALPNSNCGSRILVTTRIGDVGSSSSVESFGRVYHLQRLPPGEARVLFCKKAFRLRRGIPPPELEELSRDIVRICDGLPLAIVAIGGLLSKKEKSVAEWRALRDNLHSELANNPNLEPIKRILLLSYNHLPYHLKNCFLYFSIFPKAHFVRRITLIRLWMAEGFVEAEEGETMEKVAEGYLHDLIDRNMVQVAETHAYGRLRSCRVHDLIHEIILMKSREENFSTAQRRIKSTRRLQGKVRRLSFSNTGESVHLNTSLSHLRAFFLFGHHAPSSSSMNTLFSGFRLLRVLDLEGTFIDRLPKELAKLRHLRFLSLRNTRVKQLPNSIGKLGKLETLDLKQTYLSELPKSILMLQNLRHLLAYHYYTGRHIPFNKAYGVKVPKGIGSLQELQKLSYVKANEHNGILRELGNLTQLKRLGIVSLRTGDGRTLCTSLEKMSHLRSLSVTTTGVDELLDLEYMETPPPLQRLYLRGPLQTLPQWIVSLDNLVRMRLLWSRLRDDSIQALQTLPNLVELTLIRAYDGARLCSHSGGFRRLKILDLEKLEELKFVILDRGAMPNLRNMIIRRCDKLEMVPLGVEHLENLKELHLFEMPEVFVGRLRRNGGEDRRRVEHIRIIRCYDNQDRVYEEL
ncbi:hypothetical protein Taro_019512 [Colocasia esculenta]|uniref:Disease resistance protein RPM1-like n=1 Tax=Colocasia esculenta TaxID=4460 RepID=A0A843V2F4_COLES|nr:hypothetical protein [Colocasia esculenta]